MPFARVLCAVDGTRGSDVAVDQALTLAGPAGVTFIAVTDVRGSGVMHMATLGPQRADDALAAAAAAAADRGASAITFLRHAHAVVDALLDEAVDHDLLVLGTHRAARHAGILLGDVAATVLHRSPVPVLLARPAPWRTVFPVDILLATDGTVTTRPAVDAAAAIARRHGGQVTLLQVGSAAKQGLADHKRLLAERTGHEAVSVEASGDAASAIVEVARELPAALIVTGSRMLTGIRALRSVSERVGRAAPCSVLVLRG